MKKKNIAPDFLMCRPTKSLGHSEVVGLDYIVLGFGIFDKLVCIKTADGRVKVEKFFGKMRKVFKNEQTNKLPTAVGCTVHSCQR